MKASVTQIDAPIERVGDYVIIGGKRFKKPTLQRATPMAAPDRTFGCYGAIQVGQHYCDSDASINLVVMVREMPGEQVQIGIEPTWKNHRGTEYFMRGVLDTIPSSISVYDPPIAEADRGPTA